MACRPAALTHSIMSIVTRVIGWVIMYGPVVAAVPFVLLYGIAWTLLDGLVGRCRGGRRGRGTSAALAARPPEVLVVGAGTPSSRSWCLQLEPGAGS